MIYYIINKNLQSHVHICQHATSPLAHPEQVGVAKNKFWQIAS